MTPSFLCVLLAMRCIVVNATSWITYPDLPRADDMVAVGAFNGTIFLIGGSDNRRQIIKYQIDSQQFIDLGTDALDGDYFTGFGQYYTQQQHILYATHLNQFNIYNMATSEYISDWKNITFSETACKIATNYRCYICLASTEHYLFVTGGATIKSLQILDLSSYAWIQAAPSMNSARGSHACITNSDYLWVFGGATGTNFDQKIADNERIRITNITQNTWIDVDPLTIQLSGARAVSLDSIIYIIGGFGGTNGNEKQTIIHAMNANTGSITVFPDSLPFPNYCGLPIIIDAVLFVMSGFYTNVNYWDLTNNYAYYNLGTTLPTAIPTLRASSLPTSYPLTMNPSSKPSVFPLSTTYNLSNNITNTEISAHDTKTSTEITTIIMISADTEMLNTTITTAQDHDEFNPNKEDPFMLLYIGSCVICVCVLALCIMCIRAVCKQRKEEMPEINKVRSLSEAMRNEKGANNILNDNDDELDEIQPNLEIWLNNVVKLPQYYALFVNHGMSSMNDVREIKNKAQLKHIGIESVEHQELIMSAIHVFAKKEEGDKMLRVWLKNMGLPHYYPLFVENGFENMQFVKDITNVSEIRQMGIESAADQKCIMQQIVSLQQKKEYQAKDNIKTERELIDNNAMKNMMEIQLSTAGSQITDVMKKRHHQNVEIMQYWMENVVKLPVYYDNFLNNGYDSLAIIKEINDVTELVEIGIVSTKDQTQIMMEIDELKKENLSNLNIYGNRPKEGQNELMRTQEGK